MSTEKILGIDRNFIFDGFMGIVIGVAIIIFSKIFGVLGVIGIPLNLTISLDDLGRFLIIVIIAPITETFFFQQFVLSFFDDKLENFGIKVNFFFASVLSAIVFSIFHLSAYGSLQSSGGSFFSAMLMGIVFAYEVKIFKSALPTIFTHAVINFWILSKLVVIFG